MAPWGILIPRRELRVVFWEAWNTLLDMNEQGGMLVRGSRSRCRRQFLDQGGLFHFVYGVLS